jgi:hypothetical protein
MTALTEGLLNFNFIFKHVFVAVSTICTVIFTFSETCLERVPGKALVID